MPAGRPTEYDPAFCAIVIESGRVGKSVVGMACDLGVVKQTMLNWATKYPEFMDAITEAKQLSQDWWEEQGRVHLVESPMGNRINPGLYSRSMAARFPDDWREKTSTELSGPNGSPIATDNTFRVEFVSPPPRPIEG